ncbi:hypothetical protein HYC85_029324 [Camellia sinensis]|uniref:Uncharacterized protein n=1 Tax=Camellia sinensis TaxID=4442 RepID=A0A7J7FXN4_CAMSI|nr:hypothetical protein HYC85_029324 [Camellia sinensis]
MAGHNKEGFSKEKEAANSSKKQQKFESTRFACPRARISRHFIFILHCLGLRAHVHAFRGTSFFILHCLGLRGRVHQKEKSREGVADLLVLVAGGHLEWSTSQL